MEKNEKRSKQTTIVRGICEVLSRMAMPTLQNLDDELKKFGYTVIKANGEKIDSEADKQFNQQ